MTLIILAILAAIALGAITFFAVLHWEDDPFTALAAAGTVGFIALMALGLPAVAYTRAHYNDRTITCHVTDKDRGGKGGGYRIYTSDCGTLGNTDMWFRKKTNSADLWAKVKPGQVQTFHVVGWRLGLTSDFPNILEVQS